MKYRDAIAPYWHDLGAQLLQEEYVDRLRVIQANHPGDVQTCCGQMLQYWLEVDVEANWDMLIDALEQIQLNVTAARIRRDISIGKVYYITVCTHSYIIEM